MRRAHGAVDCSALLFDERDVICLVGLVCVLLWAVRFVGRITPYNKLSLYVTQRPIYTLDECTRRLQTKKDADETKQASGEQA